MGAQMVREVASKTSDIAGDGTTTATILAQAIYREGVKAVAAGANPMALKRGIETAVKAATEEVRKLSKPVSGDMIAQVGTISANSDKHIGEIIAAAMKTVGKDGVITVEESRTMLTELDAVDGMQFDRGYLSPYFVTDAERMEAVLEDPYILIHERKISNMKDLLPLLEQIARSGKPLLIIAEDVEGEALATLVVNKLRGTLNACAVKAPGFGNRRKGMLEDIATLTGGKSIMEETGIKLEGVKLEDLGRARRVTVDKDNTTIVEGGGAHKVIESRIKQLRAEIDETTSDYDREKLQERLAKLAGGVAVIKVGAGTETEMKEKKARVEDALHATRAAVEEGIVPGGGVALLRASKALAHLKLDGDEQIGVTIVKRACEEPLRQIVANSGTEGAIVVERIREHANPSFGYNAQTDNYEDLVSTGIIDPTKVTCSALQNASSIASLMLATEAMISETPVRQQLAGDVGYEPGPSETWSPGGELGVGDSSPMDSGGADSVGIGGNSDDDGPPGPLLKQPPPPPEPPPSPPPPARPERRINFWIGESERDSQPPLNIGETYIGNFRVGAPVDASLFRGQGSVIPASDVPAGGLPTHWTVIATNIELAITGDLTKSYNMERSIAEGPFDSATFDLLVPQTVDSGTARLKLRPLAAPAKLRVLIHVNNKLYRELEVELGLAGTAASTAPQGPRSGGITKDLPHATAEHINIRTTHEWTTAPGEISLTVIAPCEALLDGKAGTGVFRGKRVSFGTTMAKLKQPIEQLQRWAETFRAKYSDYLNDIEAPDLLERLKTFNPPYDWGNLPDLADARHQAQWQTVAASDELHRLAFYGRRLYNELFPDKSLLRDLLDRLPPGHRINLTWYDDSGAEWAPHIPWELLYCDDPVSGAPKDALRFWGLRFRIQYTAYQTSDPQMALGEPQDTWCATLLFYGDSANEPATAEAKWQRTLWSSWQNQWIVPLGASGARPKAEVLAELVSPTRPAGVLYLFCHYALIANVPVLRFGLDSGNPDDILDETEIGTAEFQSHPLVFANACMTGATGIYAANELEKAFINRGCRAFIGTESKVPVQMASRFAATFFAFFLRLVAPDPMAGGEAMTQARLLLWTNYRNIGGLLYSYVNQYDLYLAGAAELTTLQRS